MTQRPIEDPTPTHDKHEAHPAFGMIQAHRITASHGQVLFDSDIKHRNTVRITLTRAERKRELNTDWIFGGNKTLFEVEMSEAQWASFVSSMNTTGVPATIRATESNWNVPGLPYDPRLAHSTAEVHDAAQRTFAKIREARDAYEEAVEQKLGAKIIKERRRALHYAIENATSNVDFTAKQLAEHAENVVQKARADIEAMVTQKAAQLGLTAGQAEGLLELPALAGETVDTEIDPFDGEPNEVAQSQGDEI